MIENAANPVGESLSVRTYTLVQQFQPSVSLKAAPSQCLKSD